ncbi:MAG: hypothetical protein M4579_000639 [Chaenotheca gracillima]|nr:MAG: hypothetical protein M4579_000639 [Chaenotheca gracillima]
MPSYYPRHGPTRLPLTPPDLDPVTKGVRDMTLPSQMPYVPYHTNPQPRYDGADHYAHQPSAFAAPSSMLYQPPAIQPTPYNIMPKSNMTLPSQMYGPIQAPILPPIRTHEGLPRDVKAPARDERTATTTTKKPEPKEDEKAMGGVAAHLDYKMDEMTDFVAEMARGMYELYQSKICLADIDLIRSVHPGSPVSPTFRKFVSQILSSTRLPSSTILLGLHYLSERVDRLSRKGEFLTGNGQIYRMLTIALLLGSKFLDDNTFQNRSWSEVTGLPVSELNSLEVQWLNAIDWKLHQPHDHRGIKAWRSHWDDWQGKLAARSVGALKLSPIDPCVQRQRSQHKTISPIQPYLPSYSSTNTPSAPNDLRPHLQTYQPTPQYDYNGWPYPPPGTGDSPPSAPHTGPTTPDYLGLGGGWSTRPPPPPYTARQGPHVMSQPPSYHHTPYVSAHSHNIWNGHGPTCGCVYCARPSDRYFMPQSFVPQSVVG